MKKIFSIMVGAVALIGACSCSEIHDGVTDIDSWPMPMPEITYTLNHPCMLHSASDIAYTKEHMTEEPWAGGYQNLLNSAYCTTSYTANPVEYLARLDAGNWGDGGGRWDDAGIRDLYYNGIHNNYTNFFRDCHAAYQLALKWQLSGDAASAATAVKILEDWAAVNKGLLLGRAGRYKDQPVDPNEYLIMFQMHQCANAAELLRGYNGWENTESFKTVVGWMTENFYPFCSQFLQNNASSKHSWMNWDLASMTSILSIGILADNQKMINEAIYYFKQGGGPGNINNEIGTVAVYKDPETGEALAQGNESGRDQCHNTLCAAMLGAFCQMAYNIGEDLFAYNDYRAIAFAQYVAKYNLVKPEVGKEYDKNMVSPSQFRYPESSLPFTTYTYGDGGTMTQISAAGRGEIRPGWDLWAGYCVSHDIKGTYVKEMAEHFAPDAGGSAYGANSGGHDQLGFSTLMHHRVK